MSGSLKLLPGEYWPFLGLVLCLFYSPDVAEAMFLEGTERKRLWALGLGLWALGLAP